MRFLLGILICGGAFIISMPVYADPKSEAITFHKAIISGMMTYIELGENSDGRSKALGLALEETVQRPVEKAQVEWQLSVQNNNKDQAFQVYKSCDIAADSLLDLSKAVSNYVQSDSTEEPEYEVLLTKLSIDLTQCEKSLGLEPTLGIQ